MAKARIAPFLRGDPAQAPLAGPEHPQKRRLPGLSEAGEAEVFTLNR